MADKNKQPQDSILEVLLSERNENKKDRTTNQQFTKKVLENDKEMLKKVGAIYTPVSKMQSLLLNMNKTQLEYKKNNQSETSKTNELLKQNISTSKELYKLVEQVLKNGSGVHKLTPVKVKKDQPTTNTFDSKNKHEESILKEETVDVKPILSSIKKDTSEIVKLLKEKNKEEVKPKKDDDFKFPPASKVIPWILPIVAAAAAARHEEVGNGVKAAIGVSSTIAKLLNPAIEASKAAAGVAKVGAAASGLKGVTTLAGAKDALKGSTHLGAMGKLGVGLGAGATLGRLHEGDTTGAAAQAVSTILPLLSKTKFGKLANVAAAAIDVGLVGRDYIKYQDKKAEAELNGEVVKSPIQEVKDDISKVGAFFGFGNKESEDPVVQNTAETNKILEEIRDKGMTPGISASSMAPAIGLGAAALLMRGGGIAKLGQGVATTGIGQRVLAGAANAKGAISGLGTSAKVGAATAGKSALKMGGKVLPGVGLVMGAYGAYDKAKKGDYTGAAIEGASGIAALIPGIGTAVSLGLQGISATRDMIKASNSEATKSIKNTNDEVNKSLISSTKTTNEELKNSNQTLSSSILSNSELTNKSIAETSKTANNSLTQSATTLTSTTNTLSSSLTSASKSLLEMIAKFSIPGAIVNGSKNVAQFFTGSAPEANSHAQGSELHSSRKNNMIAVYNSFLKAGMSEAQAKAMTAEIGRENDFGNNLWKTHTDHKNGKMNVGMMSWQNGRDKKLLEYLKKKGVLNKDGSIQRTQEALDAQAEFVVHELKGDYKRVGNKFLNNKDISYQEASKMLGKDYIGWRYTDPEYANGHTRRDNHYANLNNELYKRGIKSTKDKPKTYISKKEYEKLSKAESRPPMMASKEIQDKWQKNETARKAKLDEINRGIVSGTHVIGTKPKESANAATIPYANNATQTDSETKGSAPSNENYYNLGVKNTTIQKGVNMEGLQPSVRKAFFTMVGELFATKSPKHKIIVTSAFRSTADQEVLWKKYGKDPKRVARPGTSSHEKGLAIDIDNKSTKGADLLSSTGLLAKYNFSRPMSHEPWHIQYGAGALAKGAAAASSAAAAISDAAEPLFKDVKASAAEAYDTATQGLASILSSDAMESVREFMKGKVDNISDSNPVPKAAGYFTKDESDPIRTKPKDSGNGDFWDNLDQQLGDGTLKRQERNSNYDKVRRALGGGDGIFRQMSGKHGWLNDVFGNLFGEDNLLGEIFGVLTGQKDVAGIPKIVGKSIIGKSKTLDGIGVIGGGFGGGLASNNKDAYPLYDNQSQPQPQSQSNTNTIDTIDNIDNSEISNTTTNSSEVLSADTNIVERVNHFDGSNTVYNKDGSYVYTRKDGRISYINADGTISKIVEPGEASKNEEVVSPETEPSEITKNENSNVITHDDGSTTSYNEDGSYIYTRTDGRVSHMNADGTVSKIENPRINNPIKSDVAIPDSIGAVNGGFAGSINYDNSMNRYEDMEFEEAKFQKQQYENERMRVEVNVPQPLQTPVQQAPQGGKSSREGLGSQIFTRNPDSIVQQVALAFLRSSV